MSGSVLLDATPLGSAHAVRGVGAATRGLVEGLRALDPGRRPQLLLTGDQADVPGFAAWRVRWPGWGLYRVPDPWPELRVERSVRRIGPALFHATQPALLPAGVPGVVTLYDLIPACFPAQYLDGPGRALEARAYRRWLRRLPEARLVLAISRETADDAVRIAGVDPGRVRVVPLAAPPAPAPAGEVPDAPYALYSGGLEPHKNAALAVRALARVPGDLRLVMTGPWSRRRADRLGRLAARLGVAGRVDLEGFAAAPRLAALRAGARAVVVPSLKEGFGLPVLEALAAGVPVLASDTPALREVGGAAATYLPPTDPVAWAHALAEVTADPDARTRASVDGPRRAADFTWEATARGVAGAYAEALEA